MRPDQCNSIGRQPGVAQGRFVECQEGVWEPWACWFRSFPKRVRSRIVQRIHQGVLACCGARLVSGHRSGLGVLLGLWVQGAERIAVCLGPAVPRVLRCLRTRLVVEFRPGRGVRLVAGIVGAERAAVCLKHVVFILEELPRRDPLLRPGPARLGLLCPPRHDPACSHPRPHHNPVCNECKSGTNPRRVGLDVRRYLEGVLPGSLPKGAVVYSHG